MSHDSRRPDDGASALDRTGFHADADGATIRLHGELVLATAPQLDRVLDKALDAKPDELRLDLSDLTFMDSTGISALIHAFRRAQKQDCSFTLDSPREQISRTLKLTGVDRLICIDSREPST